MAAGTQEGAGVGLAFPLPTVADLHDGGCGRNRPGANTSWNRACHSSRSCGASGASIVPVFKVQGAPERKRPKRRRPQSG
jgi:hypothetical protein